MINAFISFIQEKTAEVVFYKAIPTKFNNLRVLINYLNLLSNKPREKV